MSDETIRIQIPATIECSYGVYVKLSGGEGLEELGVEWVMRVCEDPIRTTLVDLLRDDFVTVQVAPRKGSPEPPIAMLRAMRMGPEEERRYQEATHVIRVSAQSRLSSPPLYVLAPLALANGLAANLDGVVLDPQVPRLLAIKSLEEALPADGSVTIAKLIVSPTSSSWSGADWMTTKGMARFGLPNFEMRSIPPNLPEVLVVMNTVAHRVLHEALMQASNAGDEALMEVVLPTELLVTMEDMGVAFGAKKKATGQTSVRLAFAGKGRPGLERFIEVGPPASYKGEVDEWYPAMLSELLGKLARPARASMGAGEDAAANAGTTTRNPPRTRWILVMLVLGVVAYAVERPTWTARGGTTANPGASRPTSASKSGREPAVVR